MQDKRNPLEERMMKNVQESLREADAVLAVVDAAARPQADLAMLQPGAEWSGPPMAVVSIATISRLKFKPNGVYVMHVA